MIQKPNNIAVCFVGEDPLRTEEQISLLSGLEDKYNVEWSKRSDKLKSHYNSFSQIINEAVIETRSEFMIFINRAALPTLDDIDLMINELCNGFAHSSIASFGLWGATKELFRRVGMMDERFIGAQGEDNDFFIRIKQLDFAVSWRFRAKSYITRLRRLGQSYALGQPRTLKDQKMGLGRTILRMKWYENENTLYRTDLYSEEKRAPKWFLESKRHDIYESWSSWGDSKTERAIIPLTGGTVGETVELPTLLLDKAISNKIATTTKNKVNSTLIISHEGNTAKFKHLCSTPTQLQLVLTDEDSIQIVPDKDIKSNMWWKYNLQHGSVYDFRIHHNGRVLVHNNNYTFPSSTSYMFGLDVYDFEI